MVNPLAAETLLAAYAQGFFPMPDPEDPAAEKILWFHPDPRAILPLDGFRLSRSLARRIRRGGFVMTLDRAFEAVMRACAERKETWITEAFIVAYCDLHRRGFAHSLEVWSPDVKELWGGVYGVSLGGAFFAESMFHRRTDMSKVALYALTEHLRARGYELLEVQFLTPHLERLGAIEIPREEYLERLASALRKRTEWHDAAAHRS
jgi:leucyl/phenylalanyl-tRNA--protein transferase